MRVVCSWISEQRRERREAVQRAWQHRLKLEIVNNAPERALNSGRSTVSEQLLDGRVCGKRARPQARDVAHVNVAEKG